MRLTPLYHWSPADRYESILRDGLRPFSERTTGGSDEDDWRAPYVCLGTDPSLAWGLSGAMEWVSPIEEWDLWLVRLREGDDIRVRADFRPEIQEVRVHGAVGPDRLWWAGRRDTHLRQAVDNRT